jgi:hypothetical protein
MTQSPYQTGDLRTRHVDITQKKYRVPRQLSLCVFAFDTFQNIQLLFEPTLIALQHVMVFGKQDKVLFFNSSFISTLA